MNQGTLPGRIPWLDASRGIAEIAVVTYHVIGGLDARGIDFRSAGLFSHRWDENLLGSVPVFFVSAGILGPKLIARSSAEFWRRITRRLAWPYVAWSAIMILLSFAARGSMVQDLDVLDFFLIPFQPVMHLWFLQALIVYLIVSRLIARLGLPPVTNLVPVGIGLLALAAGLDIDTYVPWRLASYWIFFVAGYLAGPVIVRTIDQMSRWALGLLAVGAGVPALMLLGVDSKDISPLAAVFTGWLVTTAIISTSAVIAGRSPIAAVIDLIGQETLAIYVAHVAVIAAVRYALIEVGVTSFAVHLVLGVLSGVFVPLITMLAYRRIRPRLSSSAIPLVRRLV